MKKTQLTLNWTGAILITVATILLAGCDTTGQSPSAPSARLGTPNLPTVVVQLGDTWDDVVKNSTYQLGPSAMKAGTGISAPHTFVYRDSRHYMAIEAWYMLVSMRIGEEPKKISSLSIGLYSGTAASEETWVRLQDISSRMENAGWIPDSDVNKRILNERSAAELNEVWKNYPGGGSGEWKAWYDDYGNEAYVVLSKTIGHAFGSEPRLNITLHIRPANWPSKHVKKDGQS